MHWARPLAQEEEPAAEDWLRACLLAREEKLTAKQGLRARKARSFAREEETVAKERLGARKACLFAREEELAVK